ncbi:MAG: DUF1638 domain-containing protein [Notoacmeibacter sp.]|nr:DUF1638 domain-containing protein [Notoacmeibacter sp.]MCC0032153.1 DUF1638 domain-containing protein [Brucellaceae bacterium]
MTTEQPGKTADPAKRTLVIACGMLAREVLALKEQLGLDHLDLTCLPAGHHFAPQRIAPDMERAIKKARAEGYGTILAGFADCGTGGLLDKVLDVHGVERLAGPHCFAFYQRLERFEAAGDADMLAFYMTDFLCRNFETFFIRPLGLDRHPELVADYFGNYEKLVYLAQTEDPALDAVAEKAAALLGLTYERRFTGYGDLGPFLAGATQPGPD